MAVVTQVRILVAALKFLHAYFCNPLQFTLDTDSLEFVQSHSGIHSQFHLVAETMCLLMDNIMLPDINFTLHCTFSSMHYSKMETMQFQNSMILEPLCITPSTRTKLVDSRRTLHSPAVVQVAGGCVLVKVNSGYIYLQSTSITCCSVRNDFGFCFGVKLLPIESI